MRENALDKIPTFPEPENWVGWYEVIADLIPNLPSSKLPQDLRILIFHQGMLALLYAINFAPRSLFSTTPTQPFGIPQIWSSAFWGGVWGMLLVAIAPSLVAGFVVAPLKNQPIAGGFKPAVMTTG